jgi:hypothetical protein
MSLHQPYSPVTTLAKPALRVEYAVSAIPSEENP